jgi:tryptophan synthase alpha chain
VNRSVERAISGAASNQGAAFIPYLTAGFPDPDVFMDLLAALVDQGADVIELGLPFSDPLADGPVIQQSSQMALENGITPTKTLELAARAKRFLDAPLVIMSYLNPILKMGYVRFAAQAAASGVDGVIVPDLPLEEAGPWLDAATAAELAPIFLIAPTTPPERRDRIVNAGQGFVYYVSLTGVTGTEAVVDDGLLAGVREVKSRSPLPVAVGFGVSGPKEAAPLARTADGVIVGSALIRAVLSEPTADGRVRAVADLAGSIKSAVSENGRGQGAPS